MTRQLNVRIPRELYDAVQAYAEAHLKTLRDAAADLLSRGLANGHDEDTRLALMQAQIDALSARVLPEQMTDQELRDLYPTSPWADPVPMGKGLHGCRYCLSHFGPVGRRARAFDAAFVFTSAAEASRHMREEHP